MYLRFLGGWECYALPIRGRDWCVRSGDRIKEGKGGKSFGLDQTFRLRWSFNHMTCGLRGWIVTGRETFSTKASPHRHLPKALYTSLLSRKNGHTVKSANLLASFTKSKCLVIFSIYLRCHASANAILGNGDAFTGYRWSYFPSLTDETLRLRAQQSLNSIDWTALIEYAAAARSGRECRLLPDIGLGFNHIVRIIEFDDNTRWIARLRMQPVSQGKDTMDTARSIMECEHNTIQLVQKESRIPVPQIHAVEFNPNCKVMAQFMLMDCLRGNVGMDLSMKVPPYHKKYVFSMMAQIQVFYNSC